MPSKSGNTGYRSKSKTTGWSTKPRAKSATPGKSWSAAKSQSSSKTWGSSKNTSADQRRIRIPVVGGGKPMRRKRPLLPTSAGGCGCLLPALMVVVLMNILIISILL